MKSLKFSLLFALALVCLCTANIHPAKNFDAISDANALRAAVKAQDLEKITDILTRRTYAQRMAICDAYKEHLNRKLIDDLDFLSLNYYELMSALVTPLPDYYALELFKDVEPLRFETGALPDVVCTLSNAEIHAIEEAFDRQQPKAKGKFPHILNAFYQNIAFRVVHGAFELKRNESQEIDIQGAWTDAKTIHEIGEQRNEESRSFKEDRQIEEIFMTRSFKHMQKIIEFYEKLYNHPIEKAFIERGFGSVMEKGFLTMVKIFRSNAKHFATRLHDAIEGMGTDDRKLIRIIVTRSEIDLNEIKEAFKKMYDESLAQWIDDDTSGEYRRALLSIVNA